MTGEPKTGDRMFELMDGDKAMIEEKYGVDIIGWCTDNGPDAKKGRRLLFEKFSWMIILLCWAHQINLIVGDILDAKHELIGAIKIALAIITWFNNHLTPLAWLQSEQILTYNKSLIIFLPVVTRWLAHYHAVSRLLEIEGAARRLWFSRANEIIGKAGNAEKQANARRVLEPIGDGGFWDKLRR
jgi:hypothetical protein